MRNRLLRPFLILEFLIALQTVFTFWSQVGGQYHLDLMFWAWKAGLSLAAAFLLVAITANLIQNNGSITRLGLTLCSFLIVVIVAAGIVTYYYHLNEPDEQDQEDPGEDRITQIFGPPVTTPGMHSHREPSAFLPYN